MPERSVRLSEGGGKIRIFNCSPVESTTTRLSATHFGSWNERETEAKPAIGVLATALRSLNGTTQGLGSEAFYLSVHVDP
jgi:hypothetical protein